MKNRHITGIVRQAGLLCLAALTLVSCEKDKAGKGSLTVETADGRIVLPAERGEQTVTVNSNIEWRIEYGTSAWFDTDIRGSQASRNYFTISFDENTQDNIRTSEIRVFTKDNASSITVQVVQMPRYPFIMTSSESIDVRFLGAAYRLAVTTNISEVDIQVDAPPWIENASMSDGYLVFTTQTNPDRQEREGSITLSYTDAYGRKIEVPIKVVQAALNDSATAVEKDFAYVKALPAGAITENIYISGNLVADGTSKNFPANRYIIQDADANAVVFESANTILLDRFNRISVWLQGGIVTPQTEGTFTYNVITGISAAHIMDVEEDDAFVLPELYIKDLSDARLFAAVSLRNIEIASPHGAFTNFKKSISTGNPNPDYMAQYPAYYRFYSTCVRDIKGNNMYMLTNPEADFATETLPQGSGKISGIVVREVLTNFDITEDQFCIRPLERADIALENNRSNGFSEVLVEWDCIVPSGSSTFVPPVTGAPTAVLNKSNSTGFSNPRSVTTDVYQADEFRGNQTNDGRVTSQAYNSLNWSASVFWYIDKVSTRGITGAMSLQIESNGSWDSYKRNMKVQYAIADAWNASDIVWIDVPDGDYVVLGQFDRSAAEGRSADHIVGYKVYDFRLPPALNDQDNIVLRLIPDGGSITGGNRLANVSIKYNKMESGDPEGWIDAGDYEDVNLEW